VEQEEDVITISDEEAAEVYKSPIEWVDFNRLKCKGKACKVPDLTSEYAPNAKPGDKNYKKEAKRAFRKAFREARTAFEGKPAPYFKWDHESWTGKKYVWYGTRLSGEKMKKAVEEAQEKAIELSPDDLSTPEETAASAHEEESPRSYTPTQFSDAGFAESRVLGPMQGYTDGVREFWIATVRAGRGQGISKHPGIYDNAGKLVGYVEDGRFHFEDMGTAVEKVRAAGSHMRAGQPNFIGHGRAPGQGSSIERDGTSNRGTTEISHDFDRLLDNFANIQGLTRDELGLSAEMLQKVATANPDLLMNVLQGAAAVALQKKDPTAHPGEIRNQAKNAAALRRQAHDARKLDAGIAGDADRARARLEAENWD